MNMLILGHGSIIAFFEVRRLFHDLPEHFIVPLRTPSCSGAARTRIESMDVCGRDENGVNDELFHTLNSRFASCSSSSFASAVSQPPMRSPACLSTPV